MILVVGTAFVYRRNHQKSKLPVIESEDRRIVMHQYDLRTLVEVAMGGEGHLQAETTVIFVNL